MKTFAKTIIALFCFAVFNASIYAEEKNALQGMSDMSGMKAEQVDAHLKQVQEYMLKNYDFMRQIRETKDEKEQSRLKDEWLKAMKHPINQVPKQLMMHGMPEYNAPEK